MRKRSKHNISEFKLITAQMGELIPLSAIPVLPGDTFQHQTESLIRVAPLNTPVMHPTAVRIHHFFVPNRIVWPQSENGGWEEFITGGPDGNNTQSPPTVTVATSNKKGILQYLGVPPNGESITVNALALRAVNLCYNEYYRDELIENTPVSLSNNDVKRISWAKDYFSTARPYTQLGPDVSLPVGSKAHITTDGATGDDVLVKLAGTNDWRALDAATPNATIDSVNVPGGNGELYADLSSGAINVNDFRAAFSLQRYQEARMRYGARFTEYLRYLGITPSDARLQRPEFLAGGTTRLQFSEVLQTTPNATTGTSGETGVADLYGHGIAGARSNRYRKFFEEHGYVISFMSVRPKAVYVNGLRREWFKTTKEDYFQKELANLGQQEVYQKELYGSDSTQRFGFQDRYDEYRTGFNSVCGDFRDLLSSWHMGRELASNVALNETFTKCVPSNRIYQVTSTDPLWIMVNQRIVARRMVPKRANPRII